jgi:hypothetical protein
LNAFSGNDPHLTSRANRWSEKIFTPNNLSVVLLLQPDSCHPGPRNLSKNQLTFSSPVPTPTPLSDWKQPGWLEIFRASAWFSRTRINLEIGRKATLRHPIGEARRPTREHQAN